MWTRGGFENTVRMLEDPEDSGDPEWSQKSRDLGENSGPKQNRLLLRRDALTEKDYLGPFK